MAKQMEIVNIHVDKIFPNPRNPRLDLGDLTELTASIRENGVLQNLTVVEAGNGNYRNVLGHRRHAAAKLAGMTHVPCVIESWSEKEQIAAMMIENDQRHSLNTYEQAAGYQTMFDMGMTEDAICRAVGVSKRKVKQRLRCKDFDARTLCEAAAKSITFDTLDELYGIRDEKERNRVLALYGTREFHIEREKALARQSEEEQKTIFRSALRRAGAAESDSQTPEGVNVGAVKLDSGDYDRLIQKMKSHMTYTFRFSYGFCYLAECEKSMPDKRTPAPIGDEGTAEPRHESAPMRREERGDAFTPVYSDSESAGETFINEAEEERERFYAIEHDLREATAAAYRVRTRFIRELTEQDCKAHVNVIISFLMLGVWNGNADVTRTYPYINGEYKSRAEAIQSMTSYRAYAFPHQTLLFSACALASDEKDNGWYDTDLTYRDNPGLRRFYAFLEKLGYMISREEREMMDGTSELFNTDT